MTERLAVLIGVDHHDHAPTLNGAVNDVVDLATRLLARGVDPSNLVLVTRPVLPADVLRGVARRDATHSDIEAALQAMGAVATDDDAILVHVSGRGTTTSQGPCIVAADASPRTGEGLLPLSALTAAFAHLPVRSVLTVLDVGFGGGSDSTRTVAWPAAPAPAVSPNDPVVFANGTTGPVVEMTLDGQVRGTLSWAVGRMLSELPQDCDWTFGQLLTALRGLQQDLPRPQSPVMLPPTDTFRPIGALMGGAQHVPWRGVHASWQWVPTDDDFMSRFRAGTGEEQWNWGTGTPFPGGQFTIGTKPGGGQPYSGPGVFNYENNPFDLGTPVNSPPSVQNTDRVYQVTANYDLGGDLWMIVRNGTTPNPQATEWYTTGNADFLPVEDQGRVTFTEAQLPNQQEWSQNTWYTATQQPL